MSRAGEISYREKIMKNSLGIQLALIDTVRNNHSRILVKCEKCGGAVIPEEMELRKAPGKMNFYFGKRCKSCVSK